MVKEMNHVNTMKEEESRSSQASLEAAVTMLGPFLSGHRACSFLVIMLCSDSFGELLKSSLY